MPALMPARGVYPVTHVTRKISAVYMRAPQATKYTDNCGKNSIGLVTIFPWILVTHAIARPVRCRVTEREREREREREKTGGEEAMENGTWRLLYTASFYVHRKNAKQACTSAHTSRVRV